MMNLQPSRKITVFLVALISTIFASSSLAQESDKPSLDTPELFAAISEDTIELHWRPVHGAVRYELAIWWDGLENWEFVGGDNLTGTIWVHEDVDAETEYYYSIRAVNAAGEKSDWEGAGTNEYLSIQVSNPAFTAVYRDKVVHLDWSPVENAISYKVAAWWKEESGWSYIYTDETSYTYAHPALGYQHYFYIKAIYREEGEEGEWLKTFATITVPDSVSSDTPAPTAAPVVRTSTPTPTPTFTVAPTPGVVVETPTPVARATPETQTGSAKETVTATATATTVVTTSGCGGSPQNVTAWGIENAVLVEWGEVNEPESCGTVQGFSVGIREKGAQNWDIYTAGPNDRQLLIDNLTPGDYEIFVEVVYRQNTAQSAGAAKIGEGPSARKINEFRVANMQSGNIPVTVPADCTPTLTAKKEALTPGNDPNNPASFSVSGSWTNAGGAQSGCEAGGVYIDYRQSGRTQWDRSYRVPNQNEDLNRFIYGSLDTAVEYQFRVVAIDRRGLGTDWDDLNDEWKHESNEVTIRPSSTAADLPANAPRITRIRQVAVEGFVILDWDAPTASPDNIDDYTVEWRTGSTVDTALRSSLSITQTAGLRVALGLDNTAYVVENLSDSVRYEFRVAAMRTVGGEETLAWSEWSAPFKVRVEPFTVWFADNTPNVNLNFGRVYMFVHSNHPNASATCDINAGNIRCPPLTLVSLSVSKGSTYRIAAFGSADGLTGNSHGGSADGKIFIDDVCSAHTAFSWASAGVGELGGEIYIGWQGAYKTGGQGDSAAITGYRVSICDAATCTEPPPAPTPSPETAWTHTDLLDTQAREHRFTGLDDKTYRVRVAPISNPGTCSTKTEIAGIYDQIHNVVVSSAYTSVPGCVTDPYIEVGEGSFLAEWWPAVDNGSAVYEYRVRWYEEGNRDTILGERTLSTNRSVLGKIGHANPRLVRVTDLDNSKRYTVVVQAVNANGAGAWCIVGHPAPD